MFVKTLIAWTSRMLWKSNMSEICKHYLFNLLEPIRLIKQNKENDQILNKITILQNYQIQGEQTNNKSLWVEKIKSYLWLVEHKDKFSKKGTNSTPQSLRANRSWDIVSATVKDTWYIEMCNIKNWKLQFLKWNNHDKKRVRWYICSVSKFE